MKLYNIRWKEEELSELKRKVNNFNAKVRRLEKRGYNKDLIPKKMSFKEVKNRIKHREDLKPELDIINAFLKRGSENRVRKTKRGAVIPEFKEKEVKIKVRVINKNRRREKRMYENMEITDRNKGTGVKKKDSDSEVLPNLKDKKFKPENMSKKDFEKYLESLKEYEVTIDEKKELYVYNLYKSLFNVLPEEQFNKIADVLDKLDYDTIIEKYYTDLNMRIDFQYEKIDDDLRWETIIESWTSVLTGM